MDAEMEVAHAVAVERTLGSLNLERRVRLLTGSDFWTTAGDERIGLRPMVLADGPAGVRGQEWDERFPSVSLPSPTACAATWDEPLVRRLAGVLAAEARRKGVDVVLGPTVNLQRSPLAGRHFEYLSEDPLLSGRIGLAYVRGLQAHGVAATAKHYVCNDAETNRFSVDIQADERTLREVYLAPFEDLVVEGGVWVVMAAYNRVNGVTMTENPLLHSPLLTEWGFDGVVVSDWYAARSTEASALSGLGLVMPGPRGPWGAALVAAVRGGRVPAAAVEDKARRLLRLAARVGALPDTEQAVPVAVEPAPSDVNALLREAAAAGMVLLRNHQAALPLDPASLRRVAVLGPNAAEGVTQGGAAAEVVAAKEVSPLDGLRSALGEGIEVLHAAGVRTRRGLTLLPACRSPARIVARRGCGCATSTRPGGSFGPSTEPGGRLSGRVRRFSAERPSRSPPVSGPMRPAGGRSALPALAPSTWCWTATPSSPRPSVWARTTSPSTSSSLLSARLLGSWWRARSWSSCCFITSCQSRISPR
jgi:beta-glucosidase